MNTGYKKRLLFSLLISILLAAPLSAAEWSYNSGDGVQVQIIGQGMGHRDHIEHNPQSLTVAADSALVFQVLTQTIAKAWTTMPEPDSTVVHTASERHVFLSPTSISPGRELLYEQGFGSAGMVTSEIFGGGTPSYKVPRAFVAYYFLNNGSSAYTTGRTLNHSLWWNATDRPSTQTEMLSIPAGGESRDIQVTFVITDMDSYNQRIAVIEAQAGGVTVIDTLHQANLGDELVIKTLLLPDVPGSVDEVRTTVTSPEDDGDSIFWNGIQVEIAATNMDFGDAPDHLFPKFHTRFANDGARHLIEENFYLGYGIDSDTDGQPNIAAKGDDEDGNDDEDGIIFPGNVFVQGNTVDIVAIASQHGGYLNGWLDINGDGDWDDNHEHIFIDEALNAGNNMLQFYIPPINSLNITAFARFRFSRQTGLSYHGEAPDGEVEDYMISILYPIELSRLIAETVDNGVLIKWQTESETENLGFYIYRKAEDEQEYRVINDQLIPGQGSSQSRHDYTYLDRDIDQDKSYTYKLGHIDHNGTLYYSDPIGIKHGAPQEFILYPNYPNPFNPQTTISFQLNSEQFITIELYDIFGRKIKTLISDNIQPGTHKLIWNGKDDRNQSIPSGTYLLKFSSPSQIIQRKMTLLK
jgi:hypothetical protein